MIIRPICKREFVALPNEVLTDTRLSIETRGMLAFILSKPKTWQIRPVPLARALSSNETQVGRTKLDRMFKEATAAGYMARSAEQARKADGGFDSYVYFIGMPQDVASEVKAFEASVTFLPHARYPYTGGPCTANAQRILEKTDLENTDSAAAADARAREPLTTSEAFSVAEQIAVIAGLDDPAAWPPGWCGAAMTVEAFLREGYHPELLLTAARQVMARTPKPRPRCIDYFRSAFAEARARHEQKLPVVEILETQRVAINGTREVHSGKSATAAALRAMRRSLDRGENSDPDVGLPPRRLRQSGPVRSAGSGESYAFSDGDRRIRDRSDDWNSDPVQVAAVARGDR